MIECKMSFLLPNQQCQSIERNIVSNFSVEELKQKPKKFLAPCGTDGRLLLSGFQLLVTLTLDRVML